MGQPLSFSVKYQGGEITDYYEIYSSGEYFSSELDMKTMEPVAHYAEGGNTKIDAITGETMQANYRCKGLDGLPVEFVDRLINDGFPHIDDIFYYAEKPYGDCVEFGLSDIFYGRGK